MTPTIGIDYTAAIHQGAGIGRYAREMVRALIHLPQPPAYRLFVADADRGFARPVPGPTCTWQTTQLTERWLARLWYRLRLPLSIERWTGPLDLFHAPDFFLPPTRAGTPTLVTVHDLSFVRLPETTMPGMERHLNTWVPASVKRASHVIAVSEATRQDLIELYDTPPQKISVLYHGVTAEFRPIEEPACLVAVRQKYGLGNQPFILSVGTIQSRKNYRRLVQAFARLDPTLHLVIIGSKGWYCEDVFEEINRQQVAERVHFLGFVEDGDLPLLYNAADLFVYPSLYEGFGLPILEAMACGTPVVAADASALPEVVGQAGLLVDPYEVEALAGTMAQVLTDTVLQQQLSQAGLERAKLFTWEKMATDLFALYQTLMKENSRS